MINNVLVMAEKKQFGNCLEGVLQQWGYLVTTVDSYDISPELTRQNFDLVIPTNTMMSPAQIQDNIPEMKVSYPDARIMVLSGYTSDDFVADLEHKGVDGFLSLPFDENALQQQVTALCPIPPLGTNHVPA